MIEFWLAYFLCVSGCVPNAPEKSGNTIHYSEEACMRDARWYSIYWQEKHGELWAYGCREKTVFEPPQLP